jgi:hypothetical protein
MSTIMMIFNTGPSMNQRHFITNEPLKQTQIFHQHVDSVRVYLLGNLMCTLIKSLREVLINELFQS